MNGEDENQPMGSQDFPMRKRISSEHNIKKRETEEHLSKKAKLEGKIVFTKLKNQMFIYFQNSNK
jgi:hypothetical protein